MTATNKKYLFFAIAVLGLTVLFAVLYSNQSNVNWRETFSHDSKEPYGSFLMIEFLKASFPEKTVEILTDSIGNRLEASDAPSNYVFVGGYAFMDSIDRKNLLEFVERGNKAFFSSKSPPIDIMEAAFDDYCSEFYWDYYHQDFDTIAYFDLSHPNLSMAETGQLKITFERNFEREQYGFAYHNDDLFCYDNEHIVSLGLMNDSLTNLIQVDYGEGSFFFHTNPILFTNSILRDEAGQDYTQRLLAHLHDGDVYWDKSSQLWDFSNSNWGQGRKTFESDGPLKYILAQPSLAWAWYLALAMGFFYLIFRAKRQQRIIPVVEPNRNTSLEFISTIGRMYFIQSNHRKLALDKMSLFLAFVREQYKIPTKKLDEKFLQQLTKKAEVQQDLVEQIVQLHGNIKTSGYLSEEALIRFHKILDRFYKTCK